MNLNELKSSAKPIRFWARQAAHDCVAPNADAEANKHNEDEIGITPLHHAAFMGDIETVKAHISQKRDLEITDKQGWTPLHDAVLAQHEDIVKLLLEQKVSVNVQDEEEYYTPLHEAVRMHNPTLVALLIDAGADTTIQDMWGHTPLDLADEHGFLDLIPLLNSCS